MRWGVASLCLVLLVLFGWYFATKYSDYAARLRFPMNYEDSIKNYAGEYKLDPVLVSAVIYCESHYNASAVSQVGARGLMQLMPDTAAEVAGKLGEGKTYTDANLFNADDNIRYGCWYLRYLLDRFGDNVTNTLAAYHAGPQKVNNWLNDKNYSEDGITLKSIPPGETSKYVKRVTAAYDQYKKLYFTPK